MNNIDFNTVFNEILRNVLERSESPKQFADYLSEQIRNIVGVKTVVIATNSGERVTDLLSVSPKRRYDLAKSIFKEGFSDHDKKGIYFYDLHTEKGKFSSNLKQHNIENAIRIPLITGKQKVGFILLFDLMDTNGIDSILDLFRKLSSIFALIIRNSNLYRNMENLVQERTTELKDKNTELKDREQKLIAAIDRAEKSELQAKDIIQSALDGFWIVNRQGNFIEVNNVACEMLGYSREEMLKMHVSEVDLFDTNKGVSDKIQEIVSIGVFQSETKHKRKDGGIIDVEISGRYRISEDDFVVFVHDITERIMFEKEMKEQQVLLKKSHEIGKLGTWQINIKTSEINWTEGIYRIYDIPNGTPITMEMINALIHPEDREYVDGKWMETLEYGEAFDVQYRILVHNKIKWVRVKADIYSDANGKPIESVGFCQDITKWKKAELKISENEKSLRSLLYNLKAGVIVHDAQTKIVQTNPRACELLGLSDRQLKGLDAIHRDWKFLREDGTQMTNAEYPVNIILKNRVALENYNAGVTRPNSNNIVWLMVNGMPVFDSMNNIVQVIINFVDISERRLAEKKLIKAMEKVEQSDNLKTAFLQNMSHEVRTPLNSIMGFASLLPEEDDKELIKSYSNIIVQNSEQLVHIIDDIVLFSKLQNREIKLNYEIVDFGKLLDEVIKTFSIPKYQNGVELKIETPNDEIFVRSDYDKIKQIYLNLTSNAFKYTSKGSIHIGLKTDGKNCICYVSDTGIGIPNDEKVKIFERFYRGTNVNAGVIPGTGLGLSIVQELVELLNGKIWIESDIDQGSTFYFSLPNSNTLGGEPNL